MINCKYASDVFINIIIKLYSVHIAMSHVIIMIMNIQL